MNVYTLRVKKPMILFVHSHAKYCQIFKFFTGKCDMGLVANFLLNPSVGEF